MNDEYIENKGLKVIVSSILEKNNIDSIEAITRLCNSISFLTNSSGFEKTKNLKGLYEYVIENSKQKEIVDFIYNQLEFSITLLINIQHELL